MAPAAKWSRKARRAAGLRRLIVALRFFTIALVAWPLHADPAAAQAELLKLDHEGLNQARQAARARIESGELSTTELAPAHLTVAVASASLGDTEASQRAFVTVLALDPSFRLPASFPDEVRSPYLEARGFWATDEVPLDVSASVHEPTHTFRIAVRDPASLSARVRLRVTPEGSSETFEVTRPVQTQVSIDMAPWGQPAALSYSLTLIDEYGNRIWQRGNDERPEMLTLVQPLALPSRSEAAPGAAAQAEKPSERTSARARLLSQAPPTSDTQQTNSRRRTFALATTVTLSASALSLAGASYAHFRREQLADDWNAVRCRGQGITRSEVCAEERSELSRMQNLAIGLYSLSGAALISGVVLLALTPPRNADESPAAARCAPGAGVVSLACSFSF